MKVISTVEPPRVIFRGKTSADGTVMIRASIPAFREGTAAVIISAQSPIGNDEVKQLVSFGQLNLMDSDTLSLVGECDVILCRNVLIYFDLDSRKRCIA